MRLFFFIGFLFGAIQPSLAAFQQGEEYTGTYISPLDHSTPLIVRKEHDELMLVFVGQGKVRLKKAGKDRFRAEHVRPKATLEFQRAQSGKVTAFKWMQQLPKFSFVRMETSKKDTVSGKLAKYVGNYRLSFNSSHITRIRIREDHLTSQFINEGVLDLTQVADTHFQLNDHNLTLNYDFIADKEGKITSFTFTRTGFPEFARISDETGSKAYGFDHRGNFTRADSLRGQLSSLRANYDVLFYDLHVTVDPLHRSIRGNNKIRFRATNAFDRMQVDLFENMNIEKIMFHNQQLPFDREFNAVFIRFPSQIQKGAVDEIDIAYAGKPQTPEGSILAGGIFWMWDKEGEDWIETVTQGSGASLWWPCKDHMSDEPDSMRITVTVPKGLKDISNGRLVSAKELASDQTRFEWYVQNPISTYGVALNIGSYVHLQDKFIRGGDTLRLNFYSKPYDLTIGKKLFRHVKPMLTVFEKYFGKYPFGNDEFTVLESIYPMEHQNAVSFGPVFNPFYSQSYDSTDVKRTMWHEVAHEWWGNNVTVKDNADLWIHEAFATYAEVLAYEMLEGKAAAEKYLRDQRPSNKEPIIGFYDVNDFHLGDMYSKGVLMLHTLRNVINNDSTWFGLLRGIQDHFSRQCIDTNDLVRYINAYLHTDLTYFFDQYLRYASIPTLEWKIENQKLSYRWKADVNDFRMPVKVTTAPSTYELIRPTTDWQTLDVKAQAKDFKADLKNFYVEMQNPLDRSPLD